MAIHIGIHARLFYLSSAFRLSFGQRRLSSFGYSLICRSRALLRHGSRACLCHSIGVSLTGDAIAVNLPEICYRRLSAR